MKIISMYTYLRMSMILMLTVAPGSIIAGEYSLPDWQSRVAAETSIDRLGRLYLEFLLEEDPGSGSSYGIHGTEDDPYNYDRRLPDTTPARAAEISAARVFMTDRLGKIDYSTLSRPDQIDLHILKKKVALDEFMVNKAGVLTSPLNMVTMLGTAMDGLVFLRGK